MKNQVPTNGFLYVASLKHRFLRYAKYSAISLKDFYPDAHITIATEQKWIDKENLSMFDNVISVGDNYRAKLEALHQTPYDLTCYIDADTVIQHSDISKVFDEMTSTADIMLTRIREYSGAEVYFPGGKLEDHCGMFLYRKTPKVMKFMKKWYEQYLHQREGGEKQWHKKFDANLYPSSLRYWDQFAFWWLQNKTEYAIVREYFKEPDARWNFVSNYKEDECSEDNIVIYHLRTPTNMDPYYLDLMK